MCLLCYCSLLTFIYFFLSLDSCWTPEFADILCRLTKGIVLQAQIAGYNSHNIPEIFLFACLGPNVSILLFYLKKS